MTMAKVHTVSKENKALFPKSRVQIDDNQEFLQCAKEWTAFYRNNPHLYARKLNFGLKPFQEFILCSMFYNDYSMYVACRG